MVPENILTSTPLNNRKSIGGSLLRRRSLNPNIRVSAIRDQQSNDDDAERSSLVASEKATAPSTPQGSPRRLRETMTSSPMKEHFQGCLKLYAENKINKDNAWNLQLIDFMTTMMHRHDARMDNFQTASTLVDASSRIYSFRVDALHYDTLKVAGGLCKAAQSKRGKKDDAEAQEEGTEEANAAAPKKKKKRSKGVIVANPDMLNGDFETNDCVDPFFERLAAASGNVTSSNRAFNATLPIHNRTKTLMLRTDIRFLEENKENVSCDVDWMDVYTGAKKVACAPWTEDNHVCEPFTGFSISNWDPATEDTEARVNNWVEDNRLNLSQQALAIDVNAEVEPIPVDEANNDLYEEEPLGGLESDEEADVAVAACVARLPAASVARLTDMRPTLPHHSRLEYSYCAIRTAWAGPSHWRLKTNRASKPDRTHTTAARVTVENKRLPRTKRPLDFMGAGLVFDSREKRTEEFEPAQPAKIGISKKTLATGHTWNEANFKTPVDRGLDDTHFLKLYLRKTVMLLNKRCLEQNKAVARVSRVSQGEPLTVDQHDYDYNNENDASYCTNTVPENNEWGNEEGCAAGSPHAQAPFPEDNGQLGEMLEPPTKIPKIFIPYAMRAKKVDMKQLKHCTWKLLTEKTPTGEKEDVPETTFFSIYSKLPENLSNNMRESLSVPLALLSVLHLANENGLILEKCDDLKDFKILGQLRE